MTNSLPKRMCFLILWGIISFTPLASALGEDFNIADCDSLTPYLKTPSNELNDNSIYPFLDWDFAKILSDAKMQNACARNLLNEMLQKSELYWNNIQRKIPNSAVAVANLNYIKSLRAFLFLDQYCNTCRNSHGSLPFNIEQMNNLRNLATPILHAVDKPGICLDVPLKDRKGTESKESLKWNSTDCVKLALDSFFKNGLTADFENLVSLFKENDKTQDQLKKLISDFYSDPDGTAKKILVSAQASLSFEIPDFECFNDNKRAELLCKEIGDDALTLISMALGYGAIKKILRIASGVGKAADKGSSSSKGASDQKNKETTDQDKTSKVRPEGVRNGGRPEGSAQTDFGYRSRFGSSNRSNSSSSSGNNSNGNNRDDKYTTGNSNGNSSNTGNNSTTGNSNNTGNGNSKYSNNANDSEAGKSAAEIQKQKNIEKILKMIEDQKKAEAYQAMLRRLERQEANRETLKNAVNKNAKVENTVSKKNQIGPKDYEGVVNNNLKPARMSQRELAKTIGLDENATLADIKLRIKTLIQKAHNDKNANPILAEHSNEEITKKLTHLLGRVSTLMSAK